jgi:cell shape-determining protein MreC
MKKVVLTIKDDVCARNGKDANATELLSVASKYGTVEDYDTVIAKEKAELVAIINGLNAKLDTIAEYNVSETELPVLKAHRTSVETSVGVVKTENEHLKDSLKKADEKAKNMSKAITETLNAYTQE